MFKRLLSNKVLLPLILILFFAGLAYDIFRFYGSVDVPLLYFSSEFLMVAMAVAYFFLLTNRFQFHQQTIQQYLRTFLKIIIGLYVSVFVIQYLLDPAYSPATFPQSPETLPSVIYSNVVSLLAIIFLVPVLIILKSLFFYKRKKGTVWLTRAFIVFSLICLVSTVYTRVPLNFEFSGPGAVSNISLVAVLVLIVLLSFRNSWITFLAKRDKIIYFFVSLPLVWAAMYLFDFAFAVALPAHSLAIGVFTNITWYLMVSYTFLASCYLLLQLPTAAVFDRKMREVSSLHDLSRVISAEFDFNKLVKLITRITAEVINSDSAWLELYKPDNGQLFIASVHNLEHEHIDAFSDQIRQGLSTRIIQDNRPLLVNELRKSKDYGHFQNWKRDIGSLIAVPLTGHDGKARGILYSTKPGDFGFDPDDLTLLEAYANQAVIALDNARLLRESFDRERLEEELRIARDVQQRLLPQDIPEFDRLSIESLTITAYEVGGDYYDFVKLKDDRLGFVIGDVSGKGTSAAFYMAETKGIVQSLSRLFSSPKDLLSHANEILYETMEKKTFISMMMASVDCQKRELTFARAGHCPLLYFSSLTGKAELLQPAGIGVGLEKGKLFSSTLEEMTLALNEGDLFVFYTDGLSEARNPQGEEYTDERLRSLINANADKPVGELKNLIIDSILAFLEGRNLDDDLTLLLIKT